MKVASFKNVTVRYEKEDVLKSIDLEIEEQDHYAILGANGSGKSTLIKLFSNDLYPLYSPQTKKKIFDKEVWNIFDLKSHLGIITNDLHIEFFKEGVGISGIETVLSGFFSSFGKCKHHNYTSTMLEKAKEVMRILAIEYLGKKQLQQMSTGEIRKCVIARALVRSPKALLLDEPTVGLDIKAQKDFLQTLRVLSKTTTIIIITHHIEEVFPEIQKVALLKNGEIFKDGAKEMVLTDKNLSETFDTKLTLSRDDEGFFRFL